MMARQQQRQSAGGAAALTLVMLLTVTTTMMVALLLPAGASGLAWGAGGMLGGLGGFGPRFKRPPPGPVRLPAANATTRWGDVLDETLQRAADLCKTVRLCDATGVFTDYDSPCSECHPCSCDGACYARGDCCVDKLLRDASDELVLHPSSSGPRLQQRQQADSTSPSSSSSSSTSATAAEGTGASASSSSSSSKTYSCHSTGIRHPIAAGHAFMVDTCPTAPAADFLRNNNIDPKEVARRCATGGGSGESGPVPSHWPVWSPASSTTYRNADCALCHGEGAGRVVPWNLLIRCERSVVVVPFVGGGAGGGNTGDGAEVMRRALDEPDCALSFSHPEGPGHLASAPCRPRGARYVDACNATGGRREFDEVLWRACDLFHGDMTVGGGGGDGGGVETTYKNVFCAMCNEERVEALGECQDRLEFPFFLELNASAFSSRHVSFSGGGGGGGDGGGGGGADDVVDEDAARAEERCGCRPDEIYDKYEKECRPLHCSMTRALHDGQCRPLVANASGLSYEVAISLTPEANASVYLQDTAALKRVARNIRTAFVLQGSSSSGWDVQIDHFRVITHAQKKPADPSSSGELSLKITRFTVHIRFFSLWPEPAADLEARLLVLTTSLWNISVAGRPKRSYRAAPFHVDEKSEQTGGGGFFPDVSLLLSSSSPQTSSPHHHHHPSSVEYAVDIPDRLIRGSGTAVALQTDVYLPVKDVLWCARVAFRVVPNKTDNNNNNNGSPRSSSSRASAAPLVVVVDDTTGTVRHIPSNTLIGPELVQRVGWGQEDEDEDGVVVYFVCADAIFSEADVTGAAPVAGVRTSFIADTDTLRVASAASTTVSVIVLLLVLLLFLLRPELRAATSGKSLAALATALLLVLVLLEAGGRPFVEADVASRLCLALGASAHFFLLSAFVWILICTFAAFRRASRAWMDNNNASESSSSAEASASEGSGSPAEPFVRYVGVSLAVPFAVVAAVVVGNYLARRTTTTTTSTGAGGGCGDGDGGAAYLGYGAGVCFTSDPWSSGLGVVLPACLVLLAAGLLVAIAARCSALASASASAVVVVAADDDDNADDALNHHNHREKKTSSSSSSTPSSRRRRRGSSRRRCCCCYYWRDFVAHVALSALMAVTWLAGALAVMTDVRELLYVFLALRPALALTVLAAVVCRKRVAADLCSALCCASRNKRDRYAAYNHKFTAVDT